MKKLVLSIFTVILLSISSAFANGGIGITLSYNDISTDAKEDVDNNSTTDATKNVSDKITAASIFAEYINKPIVYANWSNPLRISRWHSKGLFIFKKVFSKDKLRYLSFNDLFNFNFEDKYFKQKYEIHENSPSEIRSAIEEQIQRLDQSWVDTQENIYLQNRFWSLFGDYDYSRDGIFIGSSFLANNRYLIE